MTAETVEETDVVDDNDAAEDVDTEQTDGDIKIEVEDDTPEEDRGRKRRPEDAEPDIPDDEEIKKYSENVQNRIRQLRWEYHEERRAKEEAERIREQAIRYAQAQRSELERLRRILAEGEKSHIDTARAGAEARLEAARAALRAANESGDSDEIAKAQEALAVAVAEANKWKDYKPQYQIPEPRAPKYPQPQPQYQMMPQQQFQPPPPTPRALEWLERNPWFGKDQRMTAYAYAVHDELKNSGEVVVDSEEYYKTLDKEMRKVFPTAFEDESQSRRKTSSHQKPGTVVAAGSRSPGKPRTVKLTASQVALARRLGISPEQYAKEMIKQETGL